MENLDQRSATLALTEPARPSCAVIGAGWSGLAAAHRLALAGKQVTLYEASPHAGGRARQASLNLAGKKLTLDNGQHMLIGGYSRTLALIDQLRQSVATSETETTSASPSPVPLIRLPLQFQSDQINLRRKGPGQLGLLMGILTAGGLSLKARLGIVSMSVRLRAANWQALPNESVAQLLARLSQSSSVIRLFWEPLCIAALNTPISKAGAQTFVNVLHDSLFLSAHSSDFLIPKTDLGSLLPDPMLAALKALGVSIRVATPVKQLRQGDAGRWIVIDRAHQASFDTVVLATPPRQTAELIEPAAPAVATELQKFEYEAIQTVYLAWPLAQAPDIKPMQLLKQDDESECHGQWLFARESQAGLALGSVVISAPSFSESVTNEVLAKRVSRQLETQLGLPAAIDAKTVHEKRATFSCTPTRPIADYMSVNEQTLPPGLVLGGDYCWHRYPATLESAVRSGEAAANALLT
ncbi:MAG: hydroxysqualene dehydroxylase HpnE [Burkholderiaceae bacterium]